MIGMRRTSNERGAECCAAGDRSGSETPADVALPTSAVGPLDGPDDCARAEPSDIASAKIAKVMVKYVDRLIVASHRQTGRDSCLLCSVRVASDGAGHAGFSSVKRPRAAAIARKARRDALIFDRQIVAKIIPDSTVGDKRGLEGLGELIRRKVTPEALYRASLLRLQCLARRTDPPR
jgi:hypothetical protein